jgi:fructose-bisphosphate aldolase class 1
MDVSNLSLQETTSIVNALNENGVEFSERTRASNRTKVIEATGPNFAKLGGIIGFDRVNELEAELHRNNLKSAPWDFGYKSGTIPILYVDSAALKGGMSSDSIEASLTRLGIQYRTRTRSSGSLNIEVVGTDMLELNKIIGHSGLQAPVKEPSRGL